MAGKRIPRTARDMHPEECAWVAGMLEGEGTFIIIKTAKQSARIAMTSTDLDTLESLRCIVGVGTITCVGDRSDAISKRKIAWEWKTQRVLDVVHLLQQIYPWMGSRRRLRIDEVLSHLGASIPDLVS